MINLQKTLSRVTHRPFTKFSVRREHKRMAVTIVLWTFNAEQPFSAATPEWTSRLGIIEFRTEKGVSREPEHEDKGHRPSHIQDFEVTEIMRTFYLNDSDAALHNEDLFLARLFDEVKIIEDHEVREFFRVDGKPIMAPHPELEAKR